MIKILDYSKVSEREILNRNNVAVADVEAAVTEILDAVRERGDAALFSYCERFDGVTLSSLEVSPAEFDAALEAAGEEFVRILKRSAANIEAFHSRQKRNNFLIDGEDGVILGQRITPIERAGLYVPGGTASYPSSVLMNAIPAKLAGVREIVMVTPPGSDGQVPAPILAAARVAGVDRVFKLGGAQAVAALAYGTESVPKVDKIVGPGNIFVATAKRRVYGLVDIDMIAGPSEILVVAERGANPRHLAADLLSQAEHDRLSTAVLVCNCAELARKVAEEIERQIPLLPRAAIARESIDTNGKVIVCEDLKEAVKASNLIAPEHLELCVSDPFALLPLVKNAGSIFLGKYTPEALGDYFAGPNHTLPTSGTARFSSPLSVDDFIKKSSFIYYTEEALKKAAADIETFAETEGLTAHANSIRVRFEKEREL